MDIEVDLHFHTSISRDSSIPVNGQTVRVIKHVGLDGIAITDHDDFSNAVKFSEALRDVGLIGIPGEEVKTEGGGEILCYFIQEGINRGTWEEVLDAVRDQGGIASLAHPFDYIRGNWWSFFSKASRDEIERFLGMLDGVEVYNARNYSPGGNHLASSFAERFGFLSFSGSDAHNVFEIGCARTIVSTDSLDLDDVLDAFVRGRVEPCREERLQFPYVPGYKFRRFVNGLWKKGHSALNSFLPAFKRLQLYWNSRSDTMRSKGGDGKGWNKGREGWNKGR
ncbi:MAG: PHP-associated domain-containing protein [Promethearchaeota archaeon]